MTLERVQPRLSRRLKFYDYVDTGDVDMDGHPVLIPSLVATVWADYRPDMAERQDSPESAVVVETTAFVVRRLHGLTARWTVEDDSGETWKITRIGNSLERNRNRVLYCTRIS